MHDRLFTHQDALGPDQLPAHAAAVGLQPGGFRQCLDSGRHAEAVRREVAEARRHGVDRTPTFLFGVREGDDSRVRIVGIARGALQWDDFRGATEELLRRAGAPKP